MCRRVSILANNNNKRIKHMSKCVLSKHPTICSALFKFHRCDATKYWEIHLKYIHFAEIKAKCIVQFSFSLTTKGNKSKKRKKKRTKKETHTIIWTDWMWVENVSILKYVGLWNKINSFIRCAFIHHFVIWCKMKCEWNWHLILCAAEQWNGKGKKE